MSPEGLPDARHKAVAFLQSLIESGVLAGVVGYSESLVAELFRQQEGMQMECMPDHLSRELMRISALGQCKVVDTSDDFA